MPCYGTFVHTAQSTYLSEQPGHYVGDRRMRSRKSDIWHTPHRRPLCYQCSEADHLYCESPYRRLGLRGFSAHSPPPRYGQRPRDVEDYLSHQRSSHLPGNSNAGPAAVSYRAVAMSGPRKLTEATCGAGSLTTEVPKTSDQRRHGKIPIPHHLLLHG
ncbi:hypothetical protein HPB50_013870 [Hyalomma asiaticum]|uniref:Uncharacterized protein n=1 Tax=Hyalomma asiaticum TaxID=266040 RepID=A0ACB7RUA0_HYAAI|nr:hypothetical protein HPB50_013870 [Hyalomma asiaticum]